MTPEALIEHLPGWNRAKGPLHRRIFEAVRGAIVRGDVAPGARLPAERVFADALSVSRSTVVAAYQGLREEGLVESRQGSGTFVPGPKSARGDEDRVETERLRRNAVLLRIVDGPGDTIEFLGAHVRGEGVVTPDVLGAAARDLVPWLRGSGYMPLGFPPLREAIARHMEERWSLPTKPEQILVTNGAQHAIALAAGLLVQRGDAVALENPTYLTAIDVFKSHGAHLVPVPVGPDGLRVEALKSVAQRSLPRLLYVAPTFQNPTGAVMPERARRELAKLADELHVPVVEDLAHADLAFGSEPPPPVAAFTRNGPVLTIGSMSKLFWGGLRVGWIRASESTVRRLARLRVVTDLGGAMLTQAVAARLLKDVPRVRSLRRAMLKANLKSLEELLAKEIPSWKWRRPAGGLTIWIELPAGSATEFQSVALRHGVGFVPGPMASPDGSCADRLRLTLILPKAEMEEGVRRLARAWRAYAPGEESSDGRLSAMGVLV